MTHPPTDQIPSLVAQAREGDLAAFSQLMEAEQSRLLGQALAFCGDADLARDLVQETMIAAWKSLSRYDGSCRFFTWLYVILLRQHQRTLGWFSRRIPLATLEQQAAASRNEAAVAEEQGPRETEVLRAMLQVGSSRVDLQACKLEYSIVSPK